MRTGDLRHRIIIQKKGNLLDKFDQPIPNGENWIDYITIWASIMPVSGSEFFSSQQIQNKVTAKIYIRHRKDLDPTMRIIHKDTIYHITGITEDNRRQVTTIYCEARSSEQEYI